MRIKKSVSLQVRPTGFEKTHATTCNVKRMNIHLSVPYFAQLFPWNYSDRRTFVQKGTIKYEIKINNIHL